MRTTIVLQSLVTCINALSSSSKHPVKTSSGLIYGHAASNRTEVTEYLGIRYAKAASGDLRFAPPEAFVSTEQHEASSYSPDCPANISPVSEYPALTQHGLSVLKKFLFQSGDHDQSEDCLSINVWTRPERARAYSTPKAVLVFIHGGRYQIPGSNSPFYNGQYLASEEDVVVVTFNYRVNIFGFSGAPGLAQNVGLLDQRLAVEWVRDNIAAFGGEPSRITIWGQSSGAAAVDWWSYKYKDDPIVHGLISDSGVAFNLTPIWPGESAKYFFNVSSMLGCSDQFSEQAVSCMRQKPFQDILDAAVEVEGTHLFQQLSLPVFRPTIDNVTVFSDYIARARAGEFAKLPYLMGNNNHESGFYRLSAFAAEIELTEREWKQWEAADFTCPTAFEATQRRKHGVNAWVYRYFGDWPNLRLYPGSGAYHGTELSMIFGTAEDVAGRPNTAAEEATSRYMMRAWAAFAQDPETGLGGLGWKLYDAEDTTLVRLGLDPTGEASFADPARYQGFCPPLNAPMPNYGAPPFS